MAEVGGATATLLPSSTGISTTPQYAINNGMRRVNPYLHKHSMFAKARWLGMTILNMFLSEFSSLGEDYYSNAITSGLITVNNKRVRTSYVIKESDFIEHVMHRHEPPVKDTLIEVLSINDDVVVVNKPPCVHVHPCGGFTHNTVQRILADEQPHNIGHAHNSSKFLLPVHRLDRLVSGVLLFARSSIAAHEITQEFQNGKVEKLYLARVVGDFPNSDAKAEQVLESCASQPCAIGLDENCSTHHLENKIELMEGFLTENSQAADPFLVSCPLKLNDTRRDGKHQCSSDGKYSQTIFRLVSTHQGESLVLCLPITGRTHQIRLHLQRLGFPIVNDPLYGPTSTTFDHEEYTSEKEDSFRLKKARPEPTRQIDMDKALKELCVCCQRGEAAAFSKDQLRVEGIYLHAVSYTTPRWSFKTKPPCWADEFLCETES